MYVRSGLIVRAGGCVSAGGSIVELVTVRRVNAVITRPAIAAASAVLVSLLVSLLGAAGASARVVQPLGGDRTGITSNAPSVRRPIASAVDTGRLTYHGGPVVHSSAPYLVFWDPSSATPASTKTLLARYFTDVAHDSGLATNDFGVLRQFSDRTGIADYAQTFSPRQVIVDTDPYPPRDATICTQVDPTYFRSCVTDDQIRTELAKLVGADGLRTDGPTSASELVTDAPIYFMVMPPDVNVCFEGDQSPVCAVNTDPGFCSFHNSITTRGNYLLYAAITLVSVESGDPTISPKNCQDDAYYAGNGVPQEPNGSPADLILSPMTHEDAETITDPLFTGWFDGTADHEVADACTNYGDPADPSNFESPFAFAPTLGGSESAGTLYDQLDNGDEYYVQSMWSNGEGLCVHRPSPGTVTASFTAPSTSHVVGSQVSFDPVASSSTTGYGSVAWSFGDGATSFMSTATETSPAPVRSSHIYRTPGRYTVTLTLVDTVGNLSRATHMVSIDGKPTVSRGSLSGLGKLEPKLTFRVSAGTSAPSLGKIVMRLPAGLSFHAKDLAKRVSVRGAGAKEVGVRTSLGHGMLTLTLERSAREVQVRISGSALSVSPKLHQRLIEHKVKTLKVILTAIDSSGTRTNLTLTLDA
jgi:hypothetical protein